MKTSYLESVWKNPIHFLACGFGAGTVKFMPGTCGTLIAIPFGLAMQAMLSPLYYMLVLLVAIAFGFWICQVTEKDFDVNDPPAIVWDEMVGFWLAMWAAPNGWQWILAAFVLFRVFDILKPWPIKLLENKLPGGFGIVADDLMAGLYTLIIIQSVVFFLFGLD
ncbi:MAG: phosphatidylglycerophosphatase A [Gammaproteobacteria bacterium]|nr:phosphatidylglycerophosphatase A [Gammaproteobacteria bacterium]